MKFFKFFLFLIFTVSVLNGLDQQIITDPELGMIVRTAVTQFQAPLDHHGTVTTRDSRLGVNWQTGDPTAIAGAVCVSPVTLNSFVQWHLNSERVSLYHDSPVPLWEHPVSDLDFGYPIAMLEDGSILAVGDGTAVKFFQPASPTPIWQHNISQTISGLVLNSDGSKVYISYADYGQGRAYVECYSYNVTTPDWSVSFDGGTSTLGISGDDSTLIFTQYGGGNSHLWVLDAGDGSVIFQGPEYNQNPPAISHDASILVNGDYNGYVHVYYFNETLGTYEEAWNYHVSGGGTSDWIGGMAISADGSTIAVGTLTFITGGYNGQIYLFNSYSPNPVWVYDNLGDYGIALDLTADGSLLAVASYGPIDNSTADFFLFRRESNIPVFEINTPGSLFAVDIAADGSFCTTGGKAVHARVMGNGGFLYNVDCDLGGGFITGIVDLEGTDDNSGVKVEIPQLIDYYAYTDYDGNFSLNNVPAGSYTVDYSKVGYVANSSLNVPVLEDETTDLGVIEMLVFGNPPFGFWASKGLGITVELSWNYAWAHQGFNIYRKRYEFDPFPEEPLATVGEDVLNYSDDSALPLIEYFYAVTADLGGGLQSPYSNLEQGWISSGYVVDEISAWVGTTPVIDGVISADEWDDAFLLDTSDFWGTYDNTIQPIGSVLGYFKINAEMTELYVAYINYNISALGNDDDVALYIDDNNDGVFAPETEANEGNYWIDYFDSGCTIRFRPIYDTGGTGAVMTLTDPQVAASDVNGYVVFEFVIPIGDEAWQINPGPENKSSLAIFVRDNDPYDFNGWWPLDNINLFNPAGFGTITYGGVPQVPPPPEELILELTVEEILRLTWQQPNINDFDHFNIYISIDASFFEIIAETIGTEYFYSEPLIPSSIYQFYVTTVNQSGMESDPSNIVEFMAVDSNNPLPNLRTELHGNYPNPFNPETIISFSTTESTENTEITIFNVKGQKVKQLVNEVLPAGSHSVVWNGTDDSGKPVASGIYFCRLHSGGIQQSRKMLLLK